MFYGCSWIRVSPDDFAQELDDYINWYNCKRIKLSLGGLSPRNIDNILNVPYDLPNFLSAPPQYHLDQQQVFQ